MASAGETPDGNFSIKGVGGEERFIFAMTNETLMIQVKSHSPNFTFMLDITEAEFLRDWLSERLHR